MNKKAVEPLIAYVLLIGFVVALAAFVYVWMTGYTTDTTADIKARVFDNELCDSLGVSVTACINSSASQDLYINVTNRGDLRTTGLVFRFIQLDNSTLGDIYEVEIGSVIRPQHSKNFSSAQLNLTWAVDSGTKVEVVPETEKDDILVVCNDKKGEAFFTNC